MIDNLTFRSTPIQSRLKFSVLSDQDQERVKGNSKQASNAVDIARQTGPGPATTSQFPLSDISLGPTLIFRQQVRQILLTTNGLCDVVSCLHNITTPLASFSFNNRLTSSLTISISQPDSQSESVFTERPCCDSLSVFSFSSSFFTSAELPSPASVAVPMSEVCRDKS